MFIGLKARGILSPRRGRHNNSPGWSCVSSGTQGKMKNISEPRSVAEWVAEIAANILSHSSFHPLAALGVLVNILLVTQGSGLRVSLRSLATPSQAAADAAAPWATIYRPPGSKFRGLTPA